MAATVGDEDAVTLREEVTLMPREVGYGVAKIEVVGDFDMEVETLEGLRMHISLSSRGYKVRAIPLRVDCSSVKQINTCAAQDPDEGAKWTDKIFETMQTLLLEVSPAFKSAFEKRLFDRLMQS